MDKTTVSLLVFLVLFVALFIYRDWTHSESWLKSWSSWGVGASSNPLLTESNKPPDSKFTANELANYTGYAPHTWGPSVWKLLHMVAANFSLRPTEEDREAFRAFIKGLAGILPCPSCKHHFSLSLTKPEYALTDEVLQSRLSVFAWTVKLHDAVNQKTGKTYHNDVNQWFEHYTMMRTQ